MRVRVRAVICSVETLALFQWRVKMESRCRLVISSGVRERGVGKEQR